VITFDQHCSFLSVRHVTLVAAALEKGRATKGGAVQ
jgi:hypothetical protein